jgi:HEPN domain-containing protein
VSATPGRTLVDWEAGPRRRRQLEAELARIVRVLSTRYPNSLPGGIPAEAVARPDAARALDMAADVLAFVRGRLP